MLTSPQQFRVESTEIVSMSSERKAVAHAIYQVCLHSKISAVAFSHSTTGTANSWSLMNA